MAVCFVQIFKLPVMSIPSLLPRYFLQEKGEVAIKTEKQADGFCSTRSAYPPRSLNEP